jgi:hypothetical protein
MHLADRFIGECKALIEAGDLAALKDYETAYSADSRLAWDYILMKLYIHACLHKQKFIAAWIQDLTARLDPLQQAAIRPGLAYGRRLLVK